MSLANLKLIIDLIAGGLKYCQKKRVTSLLQNTLILLALYLSASLYFVEDRHTSNANKTIIINEKISDIVKSCGVGSYVAWMVIKEGLDLNNSSAIVTDVVACQSVNKYHCPASVKFLNDIYAKTFKLSLNDVGIIRDTPSNSIVSCTIINNRLKCPNGTPNLLELIQEKLNLPIGRLSYVLVKDFKNKTIYAFSLSFTIAADPTCSQKIGNTLLESLSRTAEANL